MIPLFIFYIHIVAVVAAFTDEYQKEGVSAGALTVGFMVLIFSVGWSITTFVLKFLMNEKGFGVILNRDACTLLLLTIGEGIFYFLYYRSAKTERVTSA